MQEVKQEFKLSIYLAVKNTLSDITLILLRQQNDRIDNGLEASDEVLEVVKLIDEYKEKITEIKIKNDSGKETDCFEEILKVSEKLKEKYTKNNMETELCQK